MRMTCTVGGGFVRFPGPRQPTPPNPDPASRSTNHRLDPISQIDDNNGNTPDQQAPRSGSGGEGQPWPATIEGRRELDGVGD
jgi:hypothetical protein